MELDRLPAELVDRLTRPFAWFLRSFEFVRSSREWISDGLILLMVVDNEKMVGLLTAGNIGELLALEAAGHEIGESVPSGRPCRGGKS